MTQRITVEGGTEVYIWHDPLGFMGDRVRLFNPNAPLDLAGVEIGAVVANDSGKYHLQLPDTEFGMSAEVLRAIADLLDDHGYTDSPQAA